MNGEWSRVVGIRVVLEESGEKSPTSGRWRIKCPMVVVFCFTIFFCSVVIRRGWRGPEQPVIEWGVGECVCG